MEEKEQNLESLLHGEYDNITHPPQKHKAVGLYRCAENRLQEKLFILKLGNGSREKVKFPFGICNHISAL